MFEQEVPASSENADGDAFWTHYWDCLSCSYPDRTGDVRSVTLISDSYSARQWHGTGMYREYLQPAGVAADVAALDDAGRRELAAAVEKAAAALVDSGAVRSETSAHLVTATA